MLIKTLILGVITGGCTTIVLEPPPSQEEIIDALNALNLPCEEFSYGVRYFDPIPELAPYGDDELIETDYEDISDRSDDPDVELVSPSVIDDLLSRTPGVVE